MAHNHTWSTDTATEPYRNQISRYPATRDWVALDELANPPAGTIPADPENLSTFVTDAFGTTREFRYADRHIYESMTDLQRITGENLPAETQDCP